MKSSASNPKLTHSRLTRFTPLRYPGGKGKLATFVKDLLEVNDLVDGEYVEPYAGGAAVALELLFHGYVSHIHINDISRPVYSFWNAVLKDTERFVRKVRNVSLTVNNWDRQKKIFSNPDDYDDLKLGFAFFFLNRTNRSGILNGGIIGGRDQSGPWKIDARFNTPDLIKRIESIASLSSRISLTCDDAKEFLRFCVRELPENSLIYLDPPYYAKGKDLYYDFYQHKDHVEIANFVKNRIRRQKWIVSYDNAEEIWAMYNGCNNMTYQLNYSARDARTGTEVMFFCDGLEIPPPSGAIRKRVA
ncbi:MAG: DNA adenine methylase [Parvibaculum sp.]|nr:DNA adenine methylase [Parvibaculum sp.]